MRFRRIRHGKISSPVLVMAVATSLLAAACGNGEGDHRPTQTALADVVEEVRTIVDSSRATPANGDFPGRPDRVLETRLWYADTALRRPACRGNRCALILLAHGFGGNTARFNAIGQRLAAAGYIVAAVSFPLTNEDAPGGFTRGILDVREQPRDLAVVTDALIAASRDRDDRLFGRIDGHNIGAMGHSLGGATVIAASRLTCCRDDRLRATAYVEPVASTVEAFFGEPYSAAGPPTLTFQGEIDFPVPPAATRKFHAALEPPKLLVEMVGGNHVNIIERFAERPDPLLNSTAKTMIAFFDHFLSGRGDRVREVIDDLRRQGHTVDYVRGGRS